MPKHRCNVDDRATPTVNHRWCTEFGEVPHCGGVDFEDSSEQFKRFLFDTNDLGGIRIADEHVNTPMGLNRFGDESFTSSSSAISAAIGVTRFYQVRQQVLQGALGAEPK